MCGFPASVTVRPSEVIPSKITSNAVISNLQDGILKFSEKSREELIDTILRQEKEIEALKKKLKEQDEREARKKELRFLRLLARAHRPRKPGQKIGHIDTTRTKPQVIDRVATQTLPRIRGRSYGGRTC